MQSLTPGPSPPTCGWGTAKERGASKAQLSAIGALVNKLSLQAHKADLVASFSGNRCTSSKDLTSDEAKAFISYLKSKDPDEVSAERQRRKIISLAHEAGYRIKGTKKVDMKRLDEWCRKYGHAHKSLNNYTLQELPALVTQFQAVRDGVVKGL